MLCLYEERPVFFLSGGVPDLELDAEASGSCDDLGGILDSDGGLRRLGELVFGVFEEDVGLAHCCRTDQDQLEHVVEVLLGL